MTESFNLFCEKGASSKTIMFLSFQMSQRRLRGAALHNALTFFLTGKCTQLLSKSFTKKGQVQLAPNTKRRSSHKPHINGQWIKMWSKPSSFLHIMDICLLDGSLSSLAAAWLEPFATKLPTQKNPLLMVQTGSTEF